MPSNSGLPPDIQEDLLGCRLSRFSLVRESTFDASTLYPCLQPIGRNLGMCLAGYSQLQQDMMRALQQRSVDRRAALSGTLEAIVLESLLSEIHGGLSESHGDAAASVRVGRIAENANYIQLFRGERTTVGSRQVGGILRTLGLFTERLDRMGRGLRLTGAVQARVHDLARAYGARAMDGPFPGCAGCKQETVM
jgi:hypothetical protein